MTPIGAKPSRLYYRLRYVGGAAQSTRSRRMSAWHGAVHAGDGQQESHLKIDRRSYFSAGDSRKLMPMNVELLKYTAMVAIYSSYCCLDQPPQSSVKADTTSMLTVT